MSICPHCEQRCDILYVDEVILKGVGAGGPSKAYAISCYNPKCLKVISISLNNEASLLKSIEETVKNALETASKKSEDGFQIFV